MATAPSLCFGVSRMHGGPDLEAAAADFAAALGQAVRVLVTVDYDALQAAVVAGEADLAWMPPLPLARALHEGAVLACLSQRRGRLLYRSALLVSAAGDRHELAALRGARAAWTNASSAGGYLVPRALLRERGVEPAELATERFFGSTSAACAAVVEGRADFATCYVSDDAAADPEVARHDLAHALGAALAQKLRILAITSPIPPDGLALSAHLPATQRAQLKSVLLELHRDPRGAAAIAALMQAERLAHATYDAMRLLTRFNIQVAAAASDASG